MKLLSQKKKLITDTFLCRIIKNSHSSDIFQLVDLTLKKMMLDSECSVDHQVRELKVKNKTRCFWTYIIADVET